MINYLSIVLLDITQQIEAIAKISSTYTTWSLSVTGASVLAIVSTSYIRPANDRIRKAYFIFIPGWLLLSASMYFGDVILRSAAAAVSTVSKEILLDIGEKINIAFDCQLTWFKWGIVCFTLWLITYLAWWILGEWEVNKKSDKP